MPRMFYETEEEADKIAEKRGKKVFKFCEGIYFVGTYDQAIERMMRKTLEQPKPYKRSLGHDGDKKE